MGRRVSHCRSTVALFFKSDMCLLIYSLQIFSSLLLYPSLIDSEGVPIYVYQNLVSWPSSLVNNNQYIYLSVCLKRKFVYKYFLTKDKLITAYVSSYYPLPKNYPLPNIMHLSLKLRSGYRIVAGPRLFL